MDSWYDAYLGVMTLVRVYEGTLKKGMKLRLMQEDAVHQADQVGGLLRRSRRKSKRWVRGTSAI